MSEIDLSRFHRIERPNEWEVTIEVRGTIRETVRASSKEEAIAIIEKKIEDGDLDADGDDLEDCRVGYVHPEPTLYLVKRNGRDWSVSRVQTGDEPREPNTYEADRVTRAFP